MPLNVRRGNGLGLVGSTAWNRPSSASRTASMAPPGSSTSAERLAWGSEMRSPPVNSTPLG